MAYPRKPSKFKAISGTLRPDRDGPDAPEFDLVTAFPDAPQHLTADGAALWRELGPQLVRAGVLQVVDLAPLEQLCYAWQRFRKKARRDDDVTASENNALLALFSSFGIGPAARRRVMAKIADAPTANRFAVHKPRMDQL
jgi:phage terminase small subunit